MAVSDQAHWVTGRLRYDGNGDLAAAEGDLIAPLLDREGNALYGKAGDAEGLAAGDEGDPLSVLFVSFEGQHRVWRYAFGADGVKAVPSPLPLPSDAVAAPLNAGIEGLTRVGPQQLLAMSERYQDTRGQYRAWVLSTATPPAPPVALRVKPVLPFSITDARLLPEGDLLTLERRFDPLHGVGMQLRRFAAEDLRRAIDEGPGFVLDGGVVANLDAAWEIDNMEGLSVRRGARGETLVYVLSDDNFQHALQSTLLMMFELQP